jgi:hypothetical protein
MIEKHILTCSHCKAELDALILIKNLIAQKDKVISNGAFFGKLKDRLRERPHLIKLKWITETGNLAKRLIPIPLLMIMVLIITLMFSRGNISNLPANNDVYRSLINAETSIWEENVDSSVILMKMIF